MSLTPALIKSQQYTTPPEVEQQEPTETQKDPQIH